MRRAFLEYIEYQVKEGDEEYIGVGIIYRRNHPCQLIQGYELKKPDVGSLDLILENTALRWEPVSRLVRTVGKSFTFRTMSKEEYNWHISRITSKDEISMLGDKNGV